MNVCMPFIRCSYNNNVLMENESSVIRLRRKLSELSREYTKDKPVQPRSRSANSRLPASDLNASFRYQRMKRKVRKQTLTCFKSL